LPRIRTSNRGSTLIAHILGFPPPRYGQGRGLYDFFNGWEASEMRRERKDSGLCYKQLITIKGDVTDPKIAR